MAYAVGSNSAVFGAQIVAPQGIKVGDVQFLSFPTVAGTEVSGALYGDGESLISAQYLDGTTYGIVPPAESLPSASSFGLAAGLTAVGDVQRFPDNIQVAGDLVSKSQGVLQPNVLGIGFAGLASDGETLLWTPDTLPPPPGWALNWPQQTATTQRFPVVPAALTADLNMYIEDGQSLEAGTDSAVLTTAQPFDTMMFSEGVRAGAVATSDTLVPLVANNYSPSFQAIGSNGETSANGFADSTAAWVRSQGVPYKMLISNVAVPGASISQIAGPSGGSTTASFAAMTAQVAAAHAIASAAGHKLVVRGLNFDQGQTENDAADYFANLANLQSDVQAMVQAQNPGQTAPVRMFITQEIFGVIGKIQLARCVATPLTHVLAGPEYCFAHTTAAQISSGANSLHLTAQGQRQKGEYRAKANRREVLQGQPWVPLSPRNITLIGRTLLVDYNVPVAPIVIGPGSLGVTDPGNAGFGFRDANGTAIVSVSVSGPTQIAVLLTQCPSSGAILFCGDDSLGSYPAGAGGVLGPTGGARIPIHDSDPELSFYPDSAAGSAYQLNNYSVVWSQTITF